ncbi:MAG: porin family protein [Hyphomicrobiales bacterium]|nr:porin family protein [Hyphomicrobiales bacterium]
MKKTIVSAIAALGIMSGAAVAADLPAREAPPAPAPVFTVFNWSGFYVGANVGYGFGRSSWRSPVAGSASATPEPSDVFGGVQIGYNYQIGSIVLGIEGDLNSGVRDTTLWSNPAFRARARTAYLGSIRARAGYAFDRALIYITGGFGFADWKYRTITFGTQVGGNNVGWTLGAGFEYALTNNWSVKAEYLHYDFGKKTAVAGTLDGVPQRVKTNVDTFKIGVNYRF